MAFFDVDSPLGPSSTSAVTVTVFTTTESAYSGARRTLKLTISGGPSTLKVGGIVWIPALGSGGLFLPYAENFSARRTFFKFFSLAVTAMVYLISVGKALFGRLTGSAVFITAMYFDSGTVPTEVVSLRKTPWNKVMAKNTKKARMAKKPIKIHLTAFNMGSAKLVAAAIAVPTGPRVTPATLATKRPTFLSTPPACLSWARAKDALAPPAAIAIGAGKNGMLAARAPDKDQRSQPMFGFVNNCRSFIESEERKFCCKRLVSCPAKRVASSAAKPFSSKVCLKCPGSDEIKLSLVSLCFSRLWVVSLNSSLCTWSAASSKFWSACSRFSGVTTATLSRAVPVSINCSTLFSIAWKIVEYFR